MPTRIPPLAAALAALPAPALAHLTGAEAHDTGHWLEGAGLLALAVLLARGLAAPRRRARRKGDDT